MAAFILDDDFGADICLNQAPQNGRSTKTNHLHRQNDENSDKNVFRHAPLAAAPA
ncbi:hypothetical protein [Agrobacterium sp.]|uniref:hypothetical protein n=1 Tax=Agrobacterium sp. TaxID=361 RepID=UPI0028AEE73B|nr:hypothetical protein [Agrobacterium sp.]